MWGVGMRSGVLKDLMIAVKRERALAEQCKIRFMSHIVDSCPRRVV